MNDVFGADTPTISEGAPAAPVPGIMTGTPQSLQGVPSLPIATPVIAPTLVQALDKATAKAAADQKVAVDPQATHAVNLAATHPNVLGATLAGAAAGSFIPGIGTVIGAGIGFLSSKYQIAGDPLGKIAGKAVSGVKAGWTKISAPATLPHLMPPQK